MSTLLEQVAFAKEQIRKQKLIAPYLYLEYGEFCAAESALKLAQQRFKRAKAVWDAFPDDPRQGSGKDLP